MRERSVHMGLLGARGPIPGLNGWGTTVAGNFTGRGGGLCGGQARRLEEAWAGLGWAGATGAPGTLLDVSKGR